MTSEQLAHRKFFHGVDDGRGRPIVVPGPPYRFSVTPAEINPPPALGSATSFDGARSEKAHLPTRARARRGADPRLHVGGRGPVRNVSARAPRRRGGEGRVHETSRSGASRLPRRLRRDEPLTELQRAQPQQAIVPGRPLPARGPRARSPPRRVGRRRRRQFPSRRDGQVRPRRRTPPRRTARAHRRVVVGERRHGTGRDRSRPGEHLRRDRRTVGTDGVRRRPADRDR